MNDEPRPTEWTRNTRQWKVGDIVIHYGDMKNVEYLMRVVSIRADGWIETEYINRVGYRKSYVNSLEALLDPSVFGIDIIER